MNKDPNDPTSLDPTTGVREISSDEFSKRVAGQLNGSSTNGVHKTAEPDEGFFATHEEADEEKELQELSDRPEPPNDIEAESAVLSAILCGPETVDKIRNILKPEHFFTESHKYIYRACLDLFDRGDPVDKINVQARLMEMGRLIQIGGPSYVADVINSSPAIINVKPYAKRVAKLYAHRELIYQCRVTEAAYQKDKNTEIHSDLLRSRLEDLKPPSSFLTSTDIFQQWAKDGPLIHEPTGIPPIDNATGGGPVYGTRWILNGAPDAGKTALLVQIGHTYARRGIAVGFLAADEEPSDLVTRFAQRDGFSRLDCEIRDPNTLGLIQDADGGLPVRFYRADMTIEAAADDLALWARQRGSQAALIVDSIQTVICAASRGSELGAREVVTANVQAFKNCAMKYKLIALATSEMNRAAYRNGNTADQNDMASGAESRAIEFLARVLLTLRSVKGSPDLVEVAIPKNKHGPSGVSFHLHLDRRRMMLFESDGPVIVDSEAAKEDEKALKERLAAEALAAQEASAALARKEVHLREEALCLSVVAEQPGIGVHELRAAMAAKLGGCGRARVDDTIARLGKRLRIEPGPRGAKLHYLN